MTTTTPTDPLMTRAKALKLYGLLAHWEEIGETGWIAALIGWEEEERARRGLQRRLKGARLGRFKPLADFDWRWPRQCDRKALEELLRLLDRYGAAELEAAITEALGRGVPHPNAVRLSLERRREQRHQPPPLAVTLPDDKRVRDLVVRPHNLDDYDQLQHPAESTDDEHNPD